MSFAIAYEPRIAPLPTGMASATPYCLASQSLVCDLYTIDSYAKPTSMKPKFQPPFSDQPVSVLPWLVNSLWPSSANPIRARPPMPAHCTEVEYIDGSLATIAPPFEPVLSWLVWYISLICAPDHTGDCQCTEFDARRQNEWPMPPLASTDSQLVTPPKPGALVQ